MNSITYKTLLNELQNLTEEQLAQTARVAPVDEPSLPVSGVWIVEEDHINPSGDGAEPISSYRNNPDWEDDIEDEPIVIKQGTVLILGSDQP